MVNFDQILGTCLGHPTDDGTILGRSRRRDLRRLRQAHHDAAVDYGRHRLDAQRQEARSVSRHVLPVWRLRRAAYRRRSVSSTESCRPANKVPWYRCDPRHRESTSGCTTRILRRGSCGHYRPCECQPGVRSGRQAALPHARALKSNGASWRTVTGRPPSASSSCAGWLTVDAAGRSAGRLKPAASRRSSPRSFWPLRQRPGDADRCPRWSVWCIKGARSPNLNKGETRWPS
jgi:hypothetical protein